MPVPDVAVDAAHAAVGELAKWGVAGLGGFALLIGRLWLDARDARRDRAELRAALVAHREATSCISDLARAASVEAMVGAEAEARRRTDEAIVGRLDRAEADIRAVDRTVATHIATHAARESRTDRSPADG